MQALIRVLLHHALDHINFLKLIQGHAEIKSLHQDLNLSINQAGNEWSRDIQ